ncbi:Uncharacterized HTH-type transcriptional regulator YozG [Durusdinium trenchii]|uniref:Uncharacterized HTH-type transcriptional regulator YozG n=1 Tax=Durusdinium trenchii TaxID=1381693 RepID=A0ABP0LRU7_9DINO
MHRFSKALAYLTLAVAIALPITAALVWIFWTPLAPLAAANTGGAYDLTALRPLARFAGFGVMLTAAAIQAYGLLGLRNTFLEASKDRALSEKAALDMKIIVNLDVMLARRKMRLKELAALIGVSEQALSMIKTNKVKGVRFETLVKICDVLDCQPGDILEFRRERDDGKIVTRYFIAFIIALIIPLSPYPTPAHGQTPEYKNTYILVAGRRLPYLYAISLHDALKPDNNNTPNAILSRNKVALDRLDGKLLGDPANLAVSEDGKSIYVVNHHGAINNAAFRQHGGRGKIAVLDADAAINPDNDRTANALRQHIDTGGFGALGIVLLPDLFAISNAENYLTEDGGNRITLVDRRTGSLRHVVELALGAPGFDCPDYPVPYTAPFGPPRGRAVLSPDATFGCFPNPNGLAMGSASDGRRYLFSANGGTDDVSVISVERALAGHPDAETLRIPVQIAPWGMTATPDGAHIIVSNGGSQRERRRGDSLSIINVDKAANGDSDAEVARVLVGTDTPGSQTHPLITTVTPDGDEIVTPNAGADNVSIVSLKKALAGNASAEIARIALPQQDGRPLRPKGSAITADGKYALITAGAGSPPFADETGLLFIIDLESYDIVSTVTGVGHSPYGVAILYR